MQVLWGIGGMVALLAVAFALSTNRRTINPRTVVGALAILQVAFAFVVLYSIIGSRALELLTNGAQAVIDSSNAGVEFLFGLLLPSDPGAGFLFASRGAPLHREDDELLIGGIGGITPTRCGQIAKFGVRAVVAGTLVNLMSAAIAGMLVG